jgi:anti-anti-sigma factor
MTEIQVIHAGTQATIILGEKLVASGVPNLRSEMKRLISKGVTSMSLDCTQLNLMDSTGIGCLVAAHNSLTALNGSLSMTQVSVDIFELLSSMRLDRRIKMSPQVTAQANESASQE